MLPGCMLPVGHLPADQGPAWAPAVALLQRMRLCLALVLAAPGAQALVATALAPLPRVVIAQQPVHQALRALSLELELELARLHLQQLVLEPHMLQHTAEMRLSLRLRLRLRLSMRQALPLPVQRVPFHQLWGLVLERQARGHRLRPVASRSCSLQPLRRQERHALA